MARRKYKRIIWKDRIASTRNRSWSCPQSSAKCGYLGEFLLEFRDGVFIDFFSFVCYDFFPHRYNFLLKLQWSTTLYLHSQFDRIFCLLCYLLFFVCKIHFSRQFCLNVFLIGKSLQLPSSQQSTTWSIGLFCPYSFRFQIVFLYKYYDIPYL